MRKFIYHETVLCFLCSEEFLNKYLRFPIMFSMLCSSASSFEELCTVYLSYEDISSFVDRDPTLGSNV
jgi:hypothetical protein